MKFSFITLFFICAGIVIGCLVSVLTKDISSLSWLSFGMDFGLTSPLVLDLGVLTLTLGATFNLNVSVIVFVILAVICAVAVSKGSRRK